MDRIEEKRLAVVLLQKKEVGMLKQSANCVSLFLLTELMQFLFIRSRAN
jgi:hypothetical protein